MIFDSARTYPRTGLRCQRRQEEKLHRLGGGRRTFSTQRPHYASVNMPLWKQRGEPEPQRGLNSMFDAHVHPTLWQRPSQRTRLEMTRSIAKSLRGSQRDKRVVTLTLPF